jgi:hypothetical protein
MSQNHLNRRQFASLTTAGIAGGVIGINGAGAAADAAWQWDPDKPPVVTGKPLVIQPVLMHTYFARREGACWRSWSRIHNDQAVSEETGRITRELDRLSARASFPLQFLPVLKVTSAEDAINLHRNNYDVVLVYPATGSGDLLRACFPQEPKKDALIFVRHRSGPVYYWYEALSTRYLKTPSEADLATSSVEDHGGVSIDDVVVDDYADLLRKMRALYGLKNFIGQRIIALGGAQGKYDPQAPTVARERYKLDIQDVTYDELVDRFETAKADAECVSRAEKCAQKYLSLPGTTLDTKRDQVTNSFLLYAIIKDWMRQRDAPAFTANGCMGRFHAIAGTPPCLAYSLLNDEGLLAFCESDFVVIPSGILLHYIAGRPVFLHNSTFPHKAMVTCAHCTAPRRMDGKKYEPAKIMTHYESDWGAAPKVEMALEQEVTFIDPEYSSGRWVGLKGIIKRNPCYEICRTQQDVEIQGNWKKLLAEARDSHWMMAYGDHLQEIGYAARKIGIQWENISETV